MTKHKRLTELSMEKKREAHQWRREAPYKESSAYLNYRVADRLDADAEALLDSDLPLVTAMGEVSRPRIGGLTTNDWVRDTLEDGNMIAEEASVTRTDLLCQPNIDISALAVDAAQSVSASNSMEKMLAYQMAMAHEMVMKISNAAMGEVHKIQHPTTFGNGLKPGAATELQRLTNSVARLMGVYQHGLLTLQRLKTGGNQTVTVQHVNIGAGGQAVIGNVQTGGGQLPGGDSIND